MYIKLIALDTVMAFYVIYMYHRGEGNIATQKIKNGIPFTKNMSAIINTSL